VSKIECFGAQLLLMPESANPDALHSLSARAVTLYQLGSIHAVNPTGGIAYCNYAQSYVGKVVAAESTELLGFLSHRRSWPERTP
jgi:hypothetical protein